MSIEKTVKPGPGALVSIGKNATVLEAVLDDGPRLLGVFTERDVVRRVVLPGLDAKTTPITEVMTKNVVTVRENADRSSVLKLMHEHYIRHLPVIDAGGKVLAIVSMRQLLRAEVQDLQQTVWELVADTTADGAGG